MLLEDNKIDETMVEMHWSSMSKSVRIILTLWSDKNNPLAPKIIRYGVLQGLFLRDFYKKRKEVKFHGA